MKQNSNLNPFQQLLWGSYKKTEPAAKTSPRVPNPLLWCQNWVTKASDNVNCNVSYLVYLSVVLGTPEKNNVFSQINVILLNLLRCLRVIYDEGSSFSLTFIPQMQTFY